MAVRSSIAKHPQKTEIEAALWSGESLRTIANQFAVSRSALSRFKDTLPGRSAETAGRMPPSVPPTPPVRTRTRPGVSRDNATLPPDEARLREVSWMKAKGASRAEIAARYRVTHGTVSEWLRQARERNLNLVRSITKDGIVAAVLERHAIRNAEIAALYDAAKASGDRRTALEILKFWQVSDQFKVDTLRDLGVLDRAEAAERTSEADDPNGLLTLVKDFASVFAFHDDPPSIEPEHLAGAEEDDAVNDRSIQAQTPETGGQRPGTDKTTTEPGQRNPPPTPGDT